MAHSYWKLNFFMDRYITKILFYAYHVKFEQISKFLPSLGKKSKTFVSSKIKVQRFVKNV
jgi:hypothetical protein